MRQLKADGSKGRAHGAAERAAPATAHSGPVLLSGVGIPRMRDTAERQALPPAFMRGEGPAAAGKASSVTASPCQLPQRGSQGCCAPFLPPAFMRGEGHAVAGGVPRGGGESPLSHASPCQLSQRESQGRFVPFLPPAFMRGEGHAVAGGVSPPQRESPLSHASRASSPRGRAKGTALRSPVIPGQSS